MPPRCSQAWILNKLRVRRRASRSEPFDKAVITVPAYFDEVRRKATQDAGYMAGFEVLDIINEPTAAAVAFGFQQGFLDPGGSAGKPLRVLVYDLGGGTFDVTLMEIRGSEFLALATDGDVRLGGYDWDQRLVDLAAAQFLREHGFDPRQDPNAAGRLWLACEDAKRTLSARAKAPVVCEYRGLSLAHRDHAAAVRGGDPRPSGSHALHRRAGVEGGRAGLARVDRCLLVGGSTRMPMVRAMMQQLSGKPPDTSVAADEAVAHGAALRAGLILAERHGRPASFSISNVNSHSLGVVGIDPLTGRKRNGILVPRNTPLPATARRTFHTSKANQRSILVEIVEGESAAADDCTQIGRCSVGHLPRDLPAKSPIKVRFHYDASGRLQVRVTVPNTDRQVETEIVRENGLTKEHMDVLAEVHLRTRRHRLSLTRGYPKSLNP